MPRDLRFAQTTIPAFSGVWPGSGRDLDQYPLNGDEQDTVEFLRATLPAAQKALNQHGLAFQTQPREDGTGIETIYKGNWYECIDCKKRNARDCIRYAWKDGFGQMSGIPVERQCWNPLWRNKNGEIVGREEIWKATIFNGWVCEACAATRQEALKKYVPTEADAPKRAGEYTTEPEHEEQTV